MLQAFDEKDCVYVSQNIVVQKLQEKLREKNYLLILDDVWNEDRQKWESFRSCLSGIGKKVGSRVLITTRTKKVASTMETLSEHMHHLEKLTNEDCWSIIKQRAFGNSSFPSELEGIGRDIASKCGGLALVANIIGGSLWNNRKKDDWLSIKDNNVWRSMEEDGGVLRVLQLSLNRLPIPALKLCFALCSIFPKDFVMGKEMLIQLWMAEGFLQPFSETHLEMEDVGDKYFNALSSYSLFQDVERDPYGSITCKMHDLIHDLAQSVSKSQTLILEDGSGRNIPANIQHLNVISNKGTATTEFGDVPKKLHTLFSQIDVLHSMSTNLKKVRVLSFCGADIDELPAFLGEMKHLRFLDVSDTKIKELPKFITKLYHLQTFRFMDCYRIERPLEGICDLLNLRHICFNNEKLMPAGIGRLPCLKTLQLFVVGQQEGHQIKELRLLNQLRGKLEIRNLDMVRDKEEAMGARLSEKDAIQELELVFGEKYTIQKLQLMGYAESSGSEDRCKHDEDILEGLQPHSNLKGLTIEHYCGKGCPSWMLETKNFLKNMMFMTFDKCPWLESIGEDLSTATCLKKLTIWQCDGLMSFPNLHGLSSLQNIEIGYCGQLKSIGEDLSTATCLKELIVKECNGLMSLPNLHGLSSLQKIKIDGCGQLKSIGEDLSTATCLKELTVKGCPSLMSFPNLHGLSSLQKIEIHRCGQLKSIGEDLSTATCLKELTVWECNGLMSFPNLHGLSSLQTLWISDCGRLRSLPSGLPSCTALRTLGISRCGGLRSLPSGLLPSCTALRTLRISWCGGLRSLPSGLPSCTALEELDISNCHNLISIPDDLRRSWSVPNPACLARLKKLTIGGFSTELKEFPDLGFIGSHLEDLTLIGWGEPGERMLDQIQHLTALESLEIEDFDVLEALPNWFGNLSSLRNLEISNCKSLKHMKAIQRFSKYGRLCIDECPELKKRCKRGSGPEWDCISHIQIIEIGHKESQWAESSIEDDDSEQQVDDNEQQDDDSELQVDDSEPQDDDSELQVDDSEQQVDGQADDNEQQDDDSEQLPVRATGLRRPFVAETNKIESNKRFKN
ncbi:hypothetical protein SLEP1_g42721 [Rubroshorea leprosula]|uniref:NB-ARC domain-containing protein n=1 Tax=Rubroshorea leprosula TaxID=152421 RepID=A0AAV5LAS9_9ROSI|nr:hypothetical protein SLEP1_g42721 [Rubroshorea leprosula]